MNIVITAGGTTEHIDAVRAITNTGTGTLASIIASRLQDRNEVDNIFYIHTKNAKKPSSIRNITLIEADDTNSVAAAVEKVLTENKIDWFIHAMAISDYYVDFVSTVDNIVKDICADDNIDLATSIKNGASRLDNSRKLSSNEDNLVVMLKKTPKIIGMIKKLSPETKLIGFKLLNNVTKEELRNVAFNLLQKNNCDYVLANDSAKITNDKHEAIMIDKTGNIISRLYTNEGIAEEIKVIVIWNERKI